MLTNILSIKIKTGHPTFLQGEHEASINICVNTKLMQVACKQISYVKRP